MSAFDTISTIERLAEQYTQLSRGNKRRKALRRIYAHAIEQMPEWM